jgi:ADP-dependent NAD(P)H-hydrate dehydratase / NAD(P)H-hydrate epimerase
MQILAAEQIREWDAYTIKNEPISSLDLMERAATKCVEWLRANQLLSHPYTIYCGKGNNGGDGLAIARMLAGKGVRVKCYILELGHKGSEDFQANLARLHDSNVEITYIQSSAQLYQLEKDQVVIDAIFGSGLNRKPDGIIAELIRHINQSGRPVISIDIPSGMFAGCSSKDNEVVKARFTLSFQCYKPAFLLPENEEVLGELVILDIGLHHAFLEQLPMEMELLEKEVIKAIYKPRKRFAHKGSFGHSLLIGGSYGKIGAIQLAARACLHSGTGLLTTYIPKCGYLPMQTTVPESMVITGSHNQLVRDTPPDTAKYQAIGIGPGLGTAPETVKAMEQLLLQYKHPTVIDADGLNILSEHQALLSKIPPFSILTPHPKEFERLFGKSANDYERVQLARKKARELQVVIVLKGHHTLIAMPGGKGYFNTTGNAGMATGGSGDVLTGMITGLLAQGYRPGEAALLGVFLHGLAGDFAAAEQSQEAMIASDIINFLPEAFKALNN